MVKKDEMSACFNEYILSDPGMKEDSFTDVINRVEKTFKNRAYRSTSDKNWLDIEDGTIMDGLLEYIRNVY